MSHFSNDPAMCRVDFFKDYGKWYETESVRFLAWRAEVALLHDVFATSLVQHLMDEKGSKLRLEGMWAVCLEPYHEHAHPLMTLVSYDVLMPIAQKTWTKMARKND